MTQTRCHFADPEEHDGFHPYCLDEEGAEALVGKWFGKPRICTRCGELHPEETLMITELEARVRGTIRNVPDFPKPGIQFKDISTVLADPRLMNDIIGWVCRPTKVLPEPTDLFVGLDARGFLFGLPAALLTGIPFVMCRKAGKLPGETVGFKYALEYGTAEIEIQEGAIHEGDRVVIVDDLLATGGTAHAAAMLVQQLGGIVTECVFITELGFLDGRKKLEDLNIPVRSLVVY